jgi:hypothetical protein
MRNQGIFTGATELTEEKSKTLFPPFSPVKSRDNKSWV